MNLFKKAAQLRRKNKRLTVPQSVKLAAKQAKKKTGVKRIKKAARKKTVRKTVRRTVGAMPVVAGLSVASQLAAAKRGLLDQIGNLEAKKFSTKKLTDKRKIAKTIAEKKALYRKL